MLRALNINLPLDISAMKNIQNTANADTAKVFNNKQLTREGMSAKQHKCTLNLTSKTPNCNKFLRFLRFTCKV